MADGTTALGGGFATVDWLIVFGTLGATTLLGLAFGRQATIREFFLGGRKLPWWAVSASIVATGSLVSVFVIVWTLIGAPPPTGTLPTMIWRHSRRAMSRQGRRPGL